MDVFFQRKKDIVNKYRKRNSLRRRNSDMKDFLKLIRVKHYIKNLLIFLPIVFSKEIYNSENVKITIMGFIAFSILASIVYIINDLRDVEKDKNHPEKCKRPLASNRISRKQAKSTALILYVILMIISFIFLREKTDAIILLFVYFFVNILYTYKLKEIPIVDVTTLAFGYLLRILFGASLISVSISTYLYLTVLSIAFYMGMGKGRNEITKSKTDVETRKVLKEYNQNFLNENMYMFLALAIMFYSLWVIEMSASVNYVIYTIPLIMVIAMKYSLSIERFSYEDPVDAMLKDKVLIILLLVFAAFVGVILYL